MSPRRPLSPLLVALLGLACAPAAAPSHGEAGRPALPEPSDPADPADPAAAPTAWSTAVAALDAELAFLETRAAEAPDQWVRQEALAATWMARARLTGDLDDHAAAEHALAAAFAVATPGSGPWETRARHHVVLHRLDAAEADMDAADGAVLLTSGVAERHMAVRGDIAWQRGHMDTAEALWETAEATASATQTRAGLAAAAWHRGDVERADRLWAALGDDLPTGQRQERAWVELQRGILDLEYDRWEQAGAHFAAADAIFDGHWLHREHRAEVLRLTGQLEAAAALYTEVLAQTDNPELIDALADVRAEQGDTAAAERLRAEARAGHEAQLARYPEAAAGHALAHLLAHGSPEEALDLALANAALRPWAPALLQLCEAWLKAGDPDAAAAVLDEVRALGWVSPEVHELGAAVAAARGDTAGAAAEREAADTLRATAFAD